MFEDKALLWKLKGGEREGFVRLYEKYKDWLLTIGACLLGEGKSAERIVGDIFIRFAKEARDLQLYGSLEEYLITCVLAHVRQQMGSKMYHVIGMDSTGPIRSDEVVKKEQVMSDAEDEEVVEGLGELPDNQREAVVLHLLGGMALKDVAKLQDASVSAAESRYRYGVDKLRKVLAGAVGVEARISRLRRKMPKGVDARVLAEGGSVLEEAAEGERSRSIWEMAGWLAGVVGAVVLVLIAVFVFTGGGGREGEEVAGFEEVTLQKAEVEREDEEEAARIEAESRRIIMMGRSRDVEGLLGALGEVEVENKILAAYYLGQFGGIRAAEALEELSEEFGGGDADNQFAAAARQIRERLADERARPVLVGLRIVEKETGEGVSGWRYRVVSSEGREVMAGETDEFGFAEAELAGGDYRFAAESWEGGEYREVSQEVSVAAVKKDLRVELGVSLRPMIYGWLVDSAGEAVQGYFDFGGEKIRADERGEFELSAPEDDKVYVCWGFDEQRGLGRGLLWSKGTESELEIVVEEFAGIVGRLIDEDGAGVTEMDVELGVVVGEGRRVVSEPVWQVVKEEDGWFRIDDVPVGLEMAVYFVDAEADDFVRVGGLEAGAAVDVGDIVVSDAMLAKLREVEEEITWDARLAGVVTDDEGVILEGVFVSVSFGEEDFNDVTDYEGRYELTGLPRGEEVVLRAEAEGYSGTFNIICDDSDFDFVLLPEGE